MIKNPLAVLAIAGLTSLLVGGLFYAVLGTSLISLIIEFLAVMATFFGLAWLLPKSKEDLEKAVKEVAEKVAKKQKEETVKTETKKNEGEKP